ncbi:ABC transporter substrate-binding protein [Corynebacterium uberis]|uniref:ABC transporter substrate-binding protein n=1 Tax=Corynebacterium TaxID=1716 RepID=UPI001D0A72A7|nr:MULTISPECIES: ABC transporter substrate-binding protein [Corynebacterium]MCZ9309104.1 ABC transporter substrate-binding protein [Corynebacterium sp. c6VSa_13]UDL76735.1 ABC transporter substrate-binding protein [Corynebacterium uberis]UDL78948.1 ABC transporter substrate-binding protein [Corynebacterium uberis]UDL81226.1 ABC transporter substrate-binding protein [Corynebacterium uberis]UDL85572.1 ABC transporter substrate-binding protein [Corynebacterium uberis]
MVDLRRVIAAAALSSIAVLSACSQGTPETQQTTSSAPAANQHGDHVSITHAWGTDEYPTHPATVVASGTAVDNLLELGITPTAVVVSTMDKNNPWLIDKLDGVHIIETADYGSLPVEKIAAEKPDLIVGDFWHITQDNYNALKDIAPTLGGIGTTGEQSGWKPQLTALGTIYGKEDQAAAVLAADEKRFGDAAADMPGLRGKTAVLTQFIKGQGIGVIADEKEPGNSFFYDLGMTIPEKVATLPNVQMGRAMISPEQVSLLDADFMVIFPASGTEAEMHALPGFDQLRQVAGKHTVFTDFSTVQGLNIPSSLSRAWVLDSIRPQLKQLAHQGA